MLAEMTVNEHAANLRRLPPPDQRRAIRERAGVSQSHIARDLDVSTTVVGHWERGTRGFSRRTLPKYIELLESLQAITEGGTNTGTAA